NINTGSLRQAIVPNHMLSRIMSIAAVLAWSAIPAGALVGGWIIKATDNVAFVYGVIGILNICIAAFFRFFTALGAAQRYVDERTRAFVSCRSSGSAGTWRAVKSSPSAVSRWRTLCECGHHSAW